MQQTTSGAAGKKELRAKKRPGGGERAGEKGRGGAEKRNKLRLVFWHGKKKKCRWRARVFPEGEN
jgi:hypothetical protein